MDEQIPLSGIPCLLQSVTPEGSGRHQSLLSAVAVKMQVLKQTLVRNLPTNVGSCQRAGFCVVYSQGLLLHFPVEHPDRYIGIIFLLN